MQKSHIVLLILVSLLVMTVPVQADDTPPADVIIESMAVKLARGVTNIATSVVELPKQTYLTIRDDGATGYVIGPLKGIGMMAYRAFMGAGEAVLFLVPQPGFYDSMIDPDYVWKGWEPQSATGTK